MRIVFSHCHNLSQINYILLLLLYLRSICECNLGFSVEDVSNILLQKMGLSLFQKTDYTWNQPKSKLETVSMFFIMRLHAFLVFYLLSLGVAKADPRKSLF